MAVVQGLGVNYDGLQPDWSNDMRYFSATGVVNIRPKLVKMPVPWSNPTPSATGTAAAQYAYWRLCAQTFATAGYYVTYGPTGPQSIAESQLTASGWTAYHDAVVAEATYMQAQGIAFGDFNIGNEIEYLVDNVTITPAQLRANIRQLAVDVKAVYTLSPISYSQNNWNHITPGVSIWAKWITEGLGVLDKFSVHIYGVITGLDVSQPDLPDFVNLYATYGSKIYISEFNLDSHAAALGSLAPSLSATAMTSMLTQIQAIITPGTPLIVYMFNGSFGGATNFAMVYPSGAINPVWFKLFTSRPTYYTSRISTPIARLSQIRTAGSNRTRVFRHVIFS